MRVAARVMCVGLVALAGAARAQRLDFGGGPRDPGPGEGLAAIALAETLEREAGAQRGAGAALRRLASGLLRAGEGAGAQGSEALLAGLTLAARREELDALLALDRDAAAVVASLAGSAEISVEARAVDLLLRDAVAPLVARAPVVCGWVEAAEAGGAGPDEPGVDDMGARLLALADERRVTSEAAAVLRELAELAVLAGERSAFARSAAAWTGLVVRASDAIAEPPAWVDMPARDRLRADFSVGVAAVLSDPPAARASLERTATVMRIVRAVDAMEGPARSRELHDAVNRLAAAADGDPVRDPAAVRRMGEAFFLALELLGAEASMPPPDDLVRQTRPMLGPLVEAHRAACASVARLLPDLLGAPDPMTLPGVIAARNSATRTREDLRMPERLSRLLSAWPLDPDRPTGPTVTRATSALGERVRQLGVSLGREREAEAALEELRGLAARSEGLLAFSGESGLRGAGADRAWALATGGQAAELTRLIDRTRESWLRSHAIEQFEGQRGGDDLRVRAIGATLPLLRDTARLVEISSSWERENPPAVNAWPGWEMSRFGAGVLAEGLARGSAELAASLLAGDDRATLDRAEALGMQYAGALLLARLDAEAARLGVGACDATAELGLGPPGEHAWLAGSRGALARVCRYTLEAAAADGARREAYVGHANRAALVVLERLPAR